jgi:hypothetical protein
MRASVSALAPLLPLHSRRLLLLAGVVAGLAGLFPAPAPAHDWYPDECCHGLDCAPVERQEWIPGSSSENGEAPAPMVWVVTTKHGSVAVPPGFPRRQSMDNQMHACMRPVRGALRLICIFLPPPT